VLPSISIDSLLTSDLSSTIQETGSLTAALPGILKLITPIWKLEVSALDTSAMQKADRILRPDYTEGHARIHRKRGQSMDSEFGFGAFGLIRPMPLFPAIIFGI